MPSNSAPNHVAIIMDGNGRWAVQRHLPRTAGHKQGVNATRSIIEHCGRSGVKTLTLFAFSSENWQRPESEVSALMELFLNSLRREVGKLAENSISIQFIGDLSAFPEKLQQQMRRAEALTASEPKMRLIIAANYGGRWDIIQAVKSLMIDVKNGLLDQTEVTVEAIDKRLTTAGIGEPDLFIRTGGEQRISNFLLWQLAYTELYFTDLLWPEFSVTELDRAFHAYASRQRRFGRTGEQLAASSDA